MLLKVNDALRVFLAVIRLTVYRRMQVVRKKYKIFPEAHPGPPRPFRKFEVVFWEKLKILRTNLHLRDLIYLKRDIVEVCARGFGSL